MTLGVLISNIKKRQSSLSYGGQRRFIKMLEKEGHKMKIKIEVFTLKKKNLEFDGVFDRFFSRSKKDLAELRNFHQKVKNNVFIFNDYEFTRLVNNKWKFYQFLKRKKEFKKRTPRTLIYKNFSQLKKILSKEGELFLKPKYGEKGSGIILLKKEDSNYLARYYQLKRKNSFKEFEERFEKIHSIKKIIGKIWRDNLYISQSKIDTAKYKNRDFDLRVLIQNMGKDWKITGIGARVAAKDSFLTNIHADGEEVSGPHLILLLRKVFAKKSERILREVKIISKEIAYYFEKKMKVPIAEMGIDLILDKTGKVWIVEVNSKPARVVYYKKKKKRLMKKTIMPLLIFAKYYLQK